MEKIKIVKDGKKMKIKTTTKALKENYTIINIGNNPNLSMIEYLSDTVFYNCGTYGWNYDAYIFGHYAIIQGYRTTGKYNAYKDNALHIVNNELNQAYKNGNYNIKEYAMNNGYYDKIYEILK